MLTSRLATMMFLQYAIWGVWLPILSRYLQASPAEGGLGFTPYQVGLIGGVGGAIGAVTAPFLAGQFADRYFPTEKFLAFLLFAGGAVKFFTAYQTTFTAWLVLSMVYSVLFMPTLALTNSLSFAHLDDPERRFPLVRVWGTVGWIAASWIFPLVWLLKDVGFQALPPFYSGTEVPDAVSRLVDALKWSGAGAMIYAVFAFFCLPHTPPKRDGVEKLAFAKAFGLLTKPSFLILVLASLPIAVIHQIYFIQTGPYFGDVLGLGASQIGPAMTIGQFAEIAVMVLTGWLLKRLGFRWVVTLGALAYFLRYAIFASTFLPTSVIVASQAIHGLCYACFFAAAFIYVDRIAPEDVRHSAQTVFGIIILGVGPVLSSYVLGGLEGILPHDSWPIDYPRLWAVLSGVGLVTAIFFALFFRDASESEAVLESEPAAADA
ncbi:MAG: MFS transporter [Acidobacteriota bacterium]